MVLGDEIEEKRSHLKGPRHLSLIPVLEHHCGFLFFWVFFLLINMERFENIREFNIQLQINEGHLLSNSTASQNGLMIYE